MRSSAGFRQVRLRTEARSFVGDLPLSFNLRPPCDQCVQSRIRLPPPGTPLLRPGVKSSLRSQMFTSLVHRRMRKRHFSYFEVNRSLGQPRYDPDIRIKGDGN